VNAGLKVLATGSASLALFEALPFLNPD